MHIPDNYLSPSSCAVLGAAMVPVWALALRRVEGDLPRERIPLLGIGAAFSFLVMMFNLPLPGGTTGHALGSTLVAVLLGPWAACLSITVALLIQALLFGDGGVIALGANSFNMAFVTPFLGYHIYSLLRGWARTERGRLIALALGSYIAITMAALCAALEFGLQPLLFKDATGLPLYCPYPLSISIPAMVLPHLAVAGLVEAGFTVAVFAFIKRVSPGLVFEGSPTRTRPIYALLLALVCLSPLGLLAPGFAWGEWGRDEIGGIVQEGRALGFVPEGMRGGPVLEAALPDYGLPGLPAVVGYLLSALAGVALLVIVFKLLALRGRRERNGEGG